MTTSQQHHLIIGSRGSQLALWQSTWVKGELERLFPGLSITVTIVKTIGDKILDVPLSMIGDKGLFTKEIEHALLDRRIDLAVHSLKDLPTVLPDGLMVGAITVREDVRDVYIAHPDRTAIHMHDLPTGAKIATGSLRRKCQILNWRPDMEIIDIRGNLNTRLAKLDSSDWHGMILARAGVIRLGMGERITDVLPIERMLPAVGQGALGIEIRSGDERTLEYVSSLSHAETRIATSAERALLRTLEGGCQVPIGSFGRMEGADFLLDGVIGSLDGKTLIRGQMRGNPENAEVMGRALAEDLVSRGGRAILNDIRGNNTIELES